MMGLEPTTFCMASKTAGNEPDNEPDGKVRVSDRAQFWDELSDTSLSSYC